MENISGIEFNRNSFGKAQSVTIDLEQYGNELKSFLDKIGANSYDDDFEKKWSDSISGDELVKRVHKHIDTLPWKK